MHLIRVITKLNRQMVIVNTFLSTRTFKRKRSSLLWLQLHIHSIAQRKKERRVETVDINSNEQYDGIFLAV